MRRRLFWKILLSFWLTFMCIVEGVWVVYALYGPSHKPLDVRISERIAGLQLASASAALSTGGKAALEAVLAAWPPGERALLTVREAGTAGKGGNTPPQSEEPPASLTRRVTVQEQGRAASYELIYDLAALRAQYHRPGPLNIPIHLLALGLVGGLMFSATLAWYLTQPIRRLRDGFGRLAQGQLEARLGGSMGRRRDELSDLARDFDAMAERLQELVAVRDQLLHDVSHELRSPLARLHLAVGLARQNPERIKASLERIEQEAYRLDDMVGELLSLARAQAGGEHCDEYFDLGELARSVVTDARFEAQASGVTIETNLEEAPAGGEGQPTVRGNAVLIRRALENVVRNALHHSMREQIVSVRLALDWQDRAFVLQVADQGSGVEPALLKTMFEPFVRAPGAAQERGFGLGLSIARRSLLAHEGTIHASNRQPHGLVVTIHLPFGPLGSG